MIAYLHAEMKEAQGKNCHLHAVLLSSLLELICCLHVKKSIKLLTRVLTFKFLCALGNWVKYASNYVNKVMKFGSDLQLVC